MKTREQLIQDNRRYHEANRVRHALQEELYAQYRAEPARDVIARLPWLAVQRRRMGVWADLAGDRHG